MSDIFISYKSDDRPVIKRVSTVLTAMGYDVWWDRLIPTGKSYDEVIEAVLSTAKVVIVFWSHQSVKSSWVKNEADEGMNRNILLPVIIEAVEIPLAYRRFQTADLINWNGDLAHEGFKSILSAIDRILVKNNGETL